MRLPRVAGRPLWLYGWAATAHVGSRASVQGFERRGEVKQAHRYRRNGVVLQPPAVYRGGWQNHATAAASGGDEEGGIRCTQGSAAAHGWHRDKVQRQVDQSTPGGKAVHMGKGDAVAEGGGRPLWLCGRAAEPMMGRGPPYSWVSAVVKLSRPIGIAVMALFRKFLQYTAAGGKNTPRRRRRVATRRGA